jgi:UDP:flavonoid glycosyltransferase YjiC (YdhE family)
VRFLFTFVGGGGHADPLVPIADAARAAGHDVAFHGTARVIARLRSRGFDGIEDPDGGSEPPAEIVPLVEPDMAHDERVLRERFAGPFARERAARMLALCPEWAPDVLVRDESDFGSLVAAERLSLPHASLVIGPAGGLMRADVVAEPIDALRAEHGLAPDPDLEAPARHLVLSPFPPSFRDPADPLPATALSTRTVALEPGGVDTVPAWIAALPDRPTVYFTLGTIFNMESGDLFARVIAGLRDLDANVVVTVGREIDPAMFGPQPEHVRIERYIPQSALLPRCDVVVSHGGAGSTIGALAAGLPSVLLPMGADQPLNAARARALGVAVALDVMRATPNEVRAAVETVLGDPRYRAAAERVRDEIAALPGPEAAVAALERIGRTP